MSSQVALASVCALSGSLLAVIAIGAQRRRRSMPAVIPFAAMIGAQAAWVFMHLGEVTANTLQGKLAWDCAQYLPYAGQACAALWFATCYAIRDVPPAQRLLRALSIVMLVLATGLAVAPWLGWLRHDVGQPAQLEYSFGFIDTLLAAMAIGCGLTAAVKVMVGLGREHPLYARQRALLGAAVGLPSAATLLGMALQLRLFGDRDLTPVTLAMGGIAAAWALGKGRLFDVMPVGRGAVLEHLLDGVFVLDRTDRLVDINPAGMRLLGHSDARTLLGAPARFVLASWPALANLVDVPDMAPREVHALEAPDGSWHDVLIAPVTDSFETTVGRIVLLRNVTRPQLALTVSNERFSALFDETFEAVILLTANGCVKTANRAALALLGMNTPDVLGASVWALPLWAQAEAATQLRSCIAGARAGSFFRFESTHKKSDGIQLTLDVSLTPLAGAHNEVAEIILEARDMTALRQAQERSLALTEQLRQAQKMESIGRLAGGVAHDFNNLLTAVKLNAELALKVTDLGNAAAPDLREMLGGILKAAEAASEITGQLLTFSRKQTIAAQNISLPDVVNGMRSFLDRLLGDNIQITITASPDCCLCVWIRRCCAKPC